MVFQRVFFFSLLFPNLLPRSSNVRTDSPSLSVPLSARHHGLGPGALLGSGCTFFFQLSSFLGTTVAEYRWRCFVPLSFASRVVADILVNACHTRNPDCALRVVRAFGVIFFIISSTLPPRFLASKSFLRRGARGSLMRKAQLPAPSKYTRTHAHTERRR